MKKQHLHRFLSCLGIMAASLAQAYEQPSVNLGFTSYLDGGPPAGPGWYFQQYVQYWSADDFNDLPFSGLGLDAWISLSQIIYQSDQDLLGGKWGVDVILPFVSLDLAKGNSPLLENSAGFGDLLIGPYVQWGPKMGDNGPVFMHRVELQMIFPTGDYDSKYALNPGSNHFSFNPYWSGTWFMAPRWTSSVRLHFLYNEKNDDPSYLYTGQGIDSFQAGMAVHGNFAISCEVVPQRFRLGINGYFFEQISDTELAGAKVSSLDERVWAFGPGMLYSFSPDNHVFANLYYEDAAKNRPQGWRLNMRWTHHF